MMGRVWPGLLALLALGAVLAALETQPLRPIWRADEFQGVEELERRLVDLTNAERRKRRLPALEVIESLRVAARQHSQEMLAEDYFSHQSPHADWATPRQRAYRAGFWDNVVAENIVMMAARGYTPDLDELARQFMYGEYGWMNSKGHRENIIKPETTHLGLGVATGDGRWYATQMFAEPYYLFEEVTLTRSATGLRVAGRAKLLRATSKIWLARDKELVEAVPVKRGAPFTFTLELPANSGVRAVGLHPVSRGDTYWVKFVWWFDTARPLDRALVMPVE